MIVNVFGTKYDTDDWEECFWKDDECKNTDRKIVYAEPADYLPEETIKKSVVDIRFEDGRKFSYYNDRFDLHVGDIVYVDGKLEGTKGRVAEINYNFKIKLSDYKKVIAVADTDVSGRFYTAGSHSVAFDSNVIPKEKIRLWFIPPQNEEEIIVNGSDESSFSLDDFKGMGISETAAKRGYDYYTENKVAYLELNKTEGYAIVEGGKSYEVEFKYNDGKISGITCSCFCTGKCKHEFAAMLQLKECLGNIRKYYAKEYEESGYFAAIRNPDLFMYAVDGKKEKSFEL